MTRRTSANCRHRAHIVCSMAAMSLVVLVTGGCARGDDHRIEVTTTFDDVADLVVDAPVQMSDVRIGEVTDIDLAPDGRRAQVRLAFDDDVAVPAAVQARLRRTSALGEKFVELRPLTDDPEAPRLRDGATIARAVVVPDVEDLVASGTELFTSISASQLAVIIEESADSIAGRAPDLALLLDRLESVTAGYAERTDTIVTLISDIDALASDVSPAAAAHARAISDLAETTAILDETAEDFLATIRSLSALAVAGEDLLTTHLDRISYSIEGLRAATRAVASEQAALGRLLQYLPGHNSTLAQATGGDFANLIVDVIICDLPGGGEVDGDRLNDCDAP
jgi:phospholipid/cholesterol/gamma-HCH transport system substrate-binding protein